MLRAVVGKHPLHIRHPGHQNHIGHEDHHADDALHQIQKQRTGNDFVKKSANDHGQQEKQADGKQQSHGHGNADDGLLESFASQLLFQPLVKFGRLLLHFVGSQISRP